MKSTELKKLIKEAVKEGIEDAFKDILLEAVKSPSSPLINTPSAPQPPFNPGLNTGTPIQQAPSNTSEMTAEDKRKLYENAMNETSFQMNPTNTPKFQPQPGFDPVNGSLPMGDVDLSMISQFVPSK